MKTYSAVPERADPTGNVYPELQFTAPDKYNRRKYFA
jgi:hypothetical protein